MKKKKKVLSTWKVVLLVIGSLVGLVGVAVLTMYLTGSFNNTKVYPENISFVKDENYNNDRYEISSSFSMTIGTSTDGVTVNKVTLSLAGGNVEGGYVSDGNIKVPQVVNIGKAFTVEVLYASYDAGLGKNCAKGGRSTLTAMSEYGLIDPIVEEIWVDVPVENISAYIYDSEDSSKSELNKVVVGTTFKVAVDFSPEKSSVLYGDSEEKMIFYKPTSNNISFDPATKTFTANRIGADDTIWVYTFTNASYQKEFLKLYGQISDFSLLTEKALGYFGEHAGSYKTTSIDVEVKESEVESFAITNTFFEGVADKYFLLSINSSNDVFNGNLGVQIKDDEGDLLNSAHAGLVGIAYLAGTDLQILGGDIMRVIVSGNEVVSVEREEYNSNKNYLSGQEIEGLGTEYYFFLPNIASFADSENYQYQISSANSESIMFKTALFIQNGNEYTIFFNKSEGQPTLNDGTTFDTLPTFEIAFETSSEEAVSWSNQNTISFIYDTDAEVSDAVDLAEQIVVDSNNTYQKVVYFLYLADSTSGGFADNGFNAFDTKEAKEYNDARLLSMTGIPADATSVWLYELSRESLTAKSAYDNKIYIFYATVQTYADGITIKYDENNRYILSQISSVRAVTIESTLSYSKMTPSISIKSAEGVDYVYNNQLYLPSIMEDGSSITVSVALEDGNESDLNKLKDIYNSNNLKVVFKNEDVVIDAFSYSDMQIDEVNYKISWNVQLLGSYNWSDLTLTAYLYYNNGRTDYQTKAIATNYTNGESSGTFETINIYVQEAATASFAFSAEDIGNYFNGTEIGTVSAVLSGTGTKILWNGHELVANDPQTVFDVLNNLLIVKIYDQYGKEIKTSKASYTFVEDNAVNYISMLDGKIHSFNSTNGESVNTSLQVEIYSSGIKTDIVPMANKDSDISILVIPFTIKSEGIAMVKYDKTDEWDNNRTPTLEEADDFSEVTISKYLDTDDEINLNKVIEVYTGDYNGDSTPVALKFNLNVDDLSASNRIGLFGTISDGFTSGGMINLTFVSAEDNDYDSEITAFKLAVPFYERTTISFNVTDENGLVDIRLNFEFKKNIEATNNFSSYEWNEYMETSGDYISVFGGERLALNTYLPLTNHEGTAVSWGTYGDISTSENITVSGGMINIPEVSSFTVATVTIYYINKSIYTYKTTLGFYINPNIIAVQQKNDIDLSELPSDGESLTDYYNFYYAIATGTNVGYLKNKNNATPYTGLTFIENAKNVLSVNENGNLVRRDGYQYATNLGESVVDIFNVYKDDTQVNFILLQGNSHTNSSTISFNIGYGSSEDVIKKVMTGASKDKYRVVQLSDLSYKLIVLSGEDYSVSNWLPEEVSPIIDSANGKFTITNLSAFNVEKNVKFINQNNSDTITIPVLFSRVGVDYVKYIYRDGEVGGTAGSVKNYYFNQMISSDAQVLSDNDIYQLFVAGQSYTILHKVGDEASVTEGSEMSGFYYDKNIPSAVMEICDIDAKYSELISINGNDLVIKNLAGDESIFAVIKLTLKANVAAGQIEYSYYFRIKITPNYSINDITYPFNSEAEYINTDGVVEINLEDKFTTKNATPDAVGSSRFGTLQDGNGSVEGEGKIVPKYVIESVKTPDGDAVAYENLITIDGPILKIDGTVGSVILAVSKQFEDVTNANQTYIFRINASSTFKYAIYAAKDGTLNEEQKESDGNYNIEVSAGNNAYTFKIDLYKSQGLDTPINDFGVIVTSGKVEDYLQQMVHKGATVYVEENSQYVAQSSLDKDIVVNSYEEVLNTENGNVTIEGEKLYKVTYKVTEGEPTIATVYVKESAMSYVILEHGTEGDYLTFTTKESITKDGSFSLGIYTDELVVFTINFNVDGGYIISYNADFQNGYATADGNNIPYSVQGGKAYSLSDLISKIINTNAASQDDIKLSFKYDVKDETGKKYVDITEKKSNETIDDYTFTFAHYSGEDIEIPIVATLYDVDGTTTVYTFTFNVVLHADFDASATYNYTKTSSIYGQDTIIFNLSDKTQDKSGLLGYLKGLLSGGTFKFADDTTGATLTAPDVAEETNYVKEFNIKYFFNEVEIFTFKVNYNYIVLPNVSLKANYSAPNGNLQGDYLSADGKTLNAEYLENESACESFLNSPAYLGKDNRFALEKADGCENASLYYTGSLVVKEINNLQVVYFDSNDATIFSKVIFSNSNDWMVTNNIFSAENSLTFVDFKLRFDLLDTASDGYVTLTLTVNNVPVDYKVVVKNTSVLSIETINLKDSADATETIYAEDLAQQADNKSFGYDRLLKYTFLAGTNATTYYARFVKTTVDEGTTSTDTQVFELDSSTAGTQVVTDLGKSYQGYEYEGTFASRSNALSNTDRLVDVQYFSSTPDLTNRIVVLYMGHEIDANVAGIQVSTNGSDYSDMGIIDVCKVDDPQTELNTTYTFNLKLKIDDNTTISTNYIYKFKLAVKFSVSTTINETHVLQSGTTTSLMSLSALGIKNAVNDYGDFTLSIYGFAGNPLPTTNNEIDSNTPLGQKHYELIDQGYATGLNPRYNHSVNTSEENDGDFENNYISLEATLNAQDKITDYTIRARGASNEGNHVAVKMEYRITCNGTSLTQSYDIIFKVEPAYAISFLNSDIASDYNYAVEETGEFNGKTETYATNSRLNPYIINNVNNQTDNQTGTTNYLYSSEATKNSILKAMLTNSSTGLQTNMANLFTYKWTKASDSTSEFNVYNQYVKEFKDVTDYTFTETSGNITFTTVKVNLGDKNYYIDAVDAHGYRVRIYFTIKAGITSQISNLNTTVISEGDQIQMGSRYKTVSYTAGKTVGSDVYNLAYQFTYSNNAEGAAVNEISFTSGMVNKLYVEWAVPDGEGGTTTKSNTVEVDAPGSSVDDTVDNTVDNIWGSEESAPSIGTTVNLYVKTTGTGKQLKVTYNGSALNASYSVGTYQEPAFVAPAEGESSLQITLRGLDANVFDTNVFAFNDGTISTLSSNVQNIKVSSISFVVAGADPVSVSKPTDSAESSTAEVSTEETTESSSEGSTSLDLGLITAEKVGNTSRYVYQKGSGSSIQATEITDPTTEWENVKVPTLPGYLYGTSDSVDAEMIITLRDGSNTQSDGSNTHELRQNITIKRGDFGELFASKDIVDGASVVKSSSASEAVYNDTLEIELAPGASVTYAITTDSLAPADETLYTTITNNRAFAHREYVRISQIGKAFADGSTYYIHKKNTTEGVTIKYGGVGVGTGSTITLTTIESSNESSKLTFNIEDGELSASATSTTRTAYFIVNKEDQFYHINETFTVYPTYKSVEAVKYDTTSFEYKISSYYKVSGTDYQYYVIDASQWASSSQLKYNTYENLTASADISEKPYMFYLEINGNATIDEMGTITTTKDFDLQTETLTITIYMKVSGCDGNFEGSVTKLKLGEVSIFLDKDVSGTSESGTVYGRCSELYERYISGYNGTRVNVSYDDCNLFGMIAGDFGEITSLSKHTSQSASESTIVAFNSLSELFATFMGNFEIPTNGTEYIPTVSGNALNSYTQFYNKAIELYNSSRVSFTKNVSNDLTRSAVIGVNHPYTMAFGGDISPELIDFQTVIANLFGFSFKTEFMNYAQDLADTYAQHRTNITNSLTTNEALENGCFYTSNGSFVFPIAVKNELASTVLAYVILDTSGLVSVWVNDITAALWATNFNISYHTDSIINNELYCKNILFVTGPDTAYAIGKNAVVYLASNETITLLGGGSSVGLLDNELDNEVNPNVSTYAYKVGEEIVFKDLFEGLELIKTTASAETYVTQGVYDTSGWVVAETTTSMATSSNSYSGTNETYRIIKINDTPYTNAILNSYTFASTGSYNCTFVKSYRDSSGSMQFVQFDITILIYDNTAKNTESIALKVGTSKNLNEIVKGTWYEIDENGNINKVTEFNTSELQTNFEDLFVTTGKMTKKYLCTVGNVVNYYEITFFVYDKVGAEINVALTPNTSYYLSNLFTGTVYDENLNIVTIELFNKNANTIETRSYYVQYDSSLYKYTVNYNLYSGITEQSQWIQDSIKISDLKSWFEIKISDSYSLYQVDTTSKKMTEVIEDETLANYSSTFERRYIAITKYTDGTDSTYSMKTFNVSFFAYINSYEAQVATVHNNAYNLTNLNDLVLSKVEAESDWVVNGYYEFASGVLKEVTRLDLSDGNAVDKELYVLVNNNLYYKFKFTFQFSDNVISLGEIEDEDITTALNNEVIKKYPTLETIEWYTYNSKTEEYTLIYTAATTTSDNTETEISALAENTNKILKSTVKNADGTFNTIYLKVGSEYLPFYIDFIDPILQLYTSLSNYGEIDLSKLIWYTDEDKTEEFSSSLKVYDSNFRLIDKITLSYSEDPIIVECFIRVETAGNVVFKKAKLNVAVVNEKLQMGSAVQPLKDGQASYTQISEFLSSCGYADCAISYQRSGSEQWIEWTPNLTVTFINVPKGPTISFTFKVGLVNESLFGTDNIVAKEITAWAYNSNNTVDLPVIPI